MPSGEIMCTTIIRSGEALLHRDARAAARPPAAAAAATATRFCTSTCAVSTLVPGLNTTSIDSCPSPVDCDVDVEHVVDAVDLLLDRRRHGLGEDLGGGAGIGRA